MADTKVSALTPATVVNAGDYLLLVQGAASIKIDIATLMTKLPTRTIVLEVSESPLSGAIATNLLATKVTANGPTYPAYTLAAGTHGMEKQIVCSSVTNAVKTITNAVWATGTVTVTSTGHGFTNGDSITIAGMTPSGYNGTYTITYVDANTFTYPLVANPGAASVFGTATKAGKAVVTVTSGSGFTTITFATTKDSVILKNLDGTWFVVGSNGAVIA